jgi:hypothetical protein
MVMQLDVAHMSMREREELKAHNQRKRRKIKIVCKKSWSLSLPKRLEEKRSWKVVKVGRKIITKMKVWERIEF